MEYSDPLGSRFTSQSSIHQGVNAANRQGAETELKAQHGKVVEQMMDFGVCNIWIPLELVGKPRYAIRAGLVDMDALHKPAAQSVVVPQLALLSGQSNTPLHLRARRCKGLRARRWINASGEIVSANSAERRSNLRIPPLCQWMLKLKG